MPEATEAIAGGDGEVNISKNKRGLYQRKELKCQICGKVCRGRSALAVHFKAKHNSESRLSDLAKEVNPKGGLGDMLRKAANWIELGHHAQGIPDGFFVEIEKQDAKIELSLRVIAFEKMRRLLTQSQDLSKVDKKVSEKIEKLMEADLAEVELSELLECRRHIIASVKSEVDYLRQVTGLRATDGRTLLMRLLENIELGVSEKPVESNSQTSLSIPHDPVEREAMRRQVQAQVKRAG